METAKQQTRATRGCRPKVREHKLGLWLRLYAAVCGLLHCVSGMPFAFFGSHDHRVMGSNLVDEYGLGQATCRCVLLSPSPPHLRLTTSTVMVIVWRLRENIIRTVLYIANVLPLKWAQLTKTVHTARLGLEFVFLCFLRCMICLYVGVRFVLPWTVESFPFMLWRWRNKLK